MSEPKYRIKDNVTIKASELLDRVTELKEGGYRLSQACASTVGDDIELWYSFDKDHVLKNLMFTVPKSMEVQSITNIIWAAFIYENEMQDLFGIKFKHSALDYGGHFFKVSEKTPWNEKDKKSAANKEERKVD